MSKAGATPGIFRADQCGSLLRPQALRDARREHALGRLDAAALRAVEDAAILEVLELQRSIGLPVCSDGEFRRKSWHQAMETAFEGISSAGPDFERYPEQRALDLAANPELAAPNPVVTGPIRPRGRIAAHEAAFLREHSTGPYKITLPSPAMVSRGWLRLEAGRAAYPTYEALMERISELYAQEAGSLAREGVPYIQVDAPRYTRFLLHERREQMRSEGIDPAREFDAVIAADNRILHAAKQAGATTAIHICHGTYIHDGRGASGGVPVSYDPEQTLAMYRRLDADIFLIEYTQRGGGAESLRDAPADKTYALGVINIRDPKLENRDDILRKIESATKYVPLERLALCPNCGFSGTAAEAWVTPDIQKRKLELLVDTASRIWG